MPLDSNKGQIADALRSFFRLTGRIPTRVDELVVPVVQVAQLYDPPWRSSPIRGSVYAETAAVAAEYGYIAVALPPGATGQFVVRKVRVIQGTAGAALTHSLTLMSHAAIAATLTDTGTVQKTEQLNKTTLAAGAAESTGVRYFIGTDPTLGLGLELWRLRIEAAGTSGPVDEWSGLIVIPNGGGLAVSARTVNVVIRVAIEIEYYPDSVPIA